MNNLLAPYVPMVDFLADYLGEQAEVVLHDLTDLEHSIIKIRNGRISGRQEGDPCTDYVLRCLKNAPSDTQYDASYLGKDCNGKPIKSGSFYIRDPEKNIIGMICINMETESYYKIRSYLDSLFSISAQGTLSTAPIREQENFGTAIGERVDDILAQAISNCNCRPEQLSSDEKQKLIGSLNDEGIFLLKGSVAKTADALGISEPSVYRYLSHLKKK